MKNRISACLVISCALFLAIFSTQAQAIDFKIKGRWVGLFEYGQNFKFSRGGKYSGAPNNYGSMDEFNAQQRWRIQLDAVASENLSGTVFFEIGLHRWGQASTGGALGADGQLVKVKNAYIDWTVPSTNIRVRMGLQRMALPGAVSQSRVIGMDAAAVNVNWQITDTVGLTAFWTRPYNDNYTGETDGSHAGFMDNMDLFGLAVPITLEGLSITPWAVLGSVGPNTLRVDSEDGSVNYYGVKTQSGYAESNTLPIGLGIKNQKLSSWGTAFWAGLAFDLTWLDPLRIAFDFNYGSIRRDDASASRSGWLALFLAEYRLDWGVPGVVAWYASGDDSNPGNGSERMPSLQRDESGGDCVSTFAFNAGRPSTLRDSLIGHSMAGTWGVGLRVRDVSLIENLSHTLRVNLIGGTNAPGLIDELYRRTGVHMTPNNYGNSMLGMENLYMTRKDYALEMGLVSNYKIYENLTFGVDLSYVALWLDKDVWGQSRMNGKDDTVADAWNISMVFIYEF